MQNLKEESIMKGRWMAVVAAIVICLGFVLGHVTPSLAGFEGGDPSLSTSYCDPTDPTCLSTLGW